MKLRSIGHLFVRITFSVLFCGPWLVSAHGQNWDGAGGSNPKSPHHEGSSKSSSSNSNTSNSKASGNPSGSGEANIQPSPPTGNFPPTVYNPRYLEKIMGESANGTSRSETESESSNVSARIKGDRSDRDEESVLVRIKGGEPEELDPVEQAPSLVSIRPALRGEWQRSWSVAISRAITDIAPELLTSPPEDLRNLCPGFGSADRASQLAVWTTVFSEIARAESQFNTKARYHETQVRDKDGRRVEQWSEGLLQLSYGNEVAYPGCSINREQNNILHPETNLACGVAIMRKQIQRKGALFPEPQHYYWSTLTNPDSVTQVEINLRFSFAQIAACRANVD